MGAADPRRDPQELCGLLRAAGVRAVRDDVRLADLTLLRVGGPATAHVVAERVADLDAVAAVVRAHRVPWTVVGRGSNLLASDAGFPGVVVVLGGVFREFSTTIEAGHAVVRAGAAVALPKLAGAVVGSGHAGFAWAVGVPGNVGGATRMNAGAHGGEMADHLEEVDLYRMRSGTLETWPVDTLGLRYRHAELPSDGLVVTATLRFPAGDAAAERAALAHVRDWRRAHQPLSRPNCGSVFTNPPGDSAGRLVEASGAKGWRVGGAAVSLRHANFVVTRDGATAADVHALVRLVQAHVAATSGVTLVEEVQRLGDFSDVVVPDTPDAVDTSEDDQ